MSGYRPTLLQRFVRDRRASAGIIFGVAALPIIFAFGMGLDYVSAARKREKLDALADAAALAAVTPTMMGQTAVQAKAVATGVFLSQVGLVSNVSFDASKLNVTITDVPNGATISRTAVVAYRATSPNTFANLLGVDALPFKGQSSSSTSSAPNTDFYLMLDTSPSMAIAATLDGIAAMVKATPTQSGGCAFACHQTNPAGDKLGNPGGIDNFKLSQNLGVTLRIDLVRQAAQNLADYAQMVAKQNNAAYRMAVYSFDNQLLKVAPLTSNFATAKSQAGDLQLLPVYMNSFLTASNNNDDMDTDWDGAMTKIQGEMPNPGTGTNNSGDRPQELLFIVTDGVVDESNGGRKMFAMGGAACDAIKANKIRIAVLYTVYNPLPTNGFYKTNIAPFQPNIGPKLEACASPGLYTPVNTGDDISSALNNLFNKAIATAHLTQ